MGKPRVDKKDDQHRPFIGHLYRAKLGSNTFSWNYNRGNVCLGPHRFHMVYYNPMGHDTPLGGGGCLITMWSNNHPVHHSQDLGKSPEVL